jgi:hypothetical protein
VKQAAKVERIAVPSFEVGLRKRSRQRRHTTNTQARFPTHPARNDIAPRLELVDVNVADLVAPARNVRDVDQAHVQEIAASINTLGYCAPLIIDQENRVLDGVSCAFR